MKTEGGEELSRLVENPNDGSAGDPWAVDLLRAAAPHRSPPGRKQRVQLNLGQASTRRAPLLLRPVIVAGVLIGCGAFASAALGHWPGWMVRAYDRLAPRPPVATALVPEPRAHPRRMAQALPAPVEAIAPPNAVVAVPAVAGISTNRDATVVPPRARRVPSPVAGEDTSIVLEAMRALRLDRNPVRARVLLAKYLDRHPNGTLAEEALAMSIEAAVAHHDPDAAVLGARYLRLYPTGPFHALARQTQR